MFLKDRYGLHILGATLFLSILSGCKFLHTQYSYEYSDGTTDLLEYKFEGKKLKLLDTRNYSNYQAVRIDTWFDDCKIFDEENWHCQGSNDVRGFEEIEMKGGVITWSLGDEAKIYKKTYTFKFE
jgi:hypothetical protein